MSENRGTSSQGRGKQNGERKKLDWQTAEQFQHQDVCGQINTTELNGRRLYSVQIGRYQVDRDTQEDVPFYARVYFKPQEIEQLRTLCDKVKDWIDADKAERGDDGQPRYGRHA